MYILKYSDNDLIVVSKNHSVPFHKGNQPIGLVEKIRKDLQLSELYPVHRLDTMTSGLLIFARNKLAASSLASLFRGRLVEKFYIALAPGCPKKKQGTIAGDMKKGRNGVWILSHSLTRPAVTQFFSAGLGNGLRLYVLHPYTGRTHQLRVMMKSLGVPILGDPAYYKCSDKFSDPIDRGYLHAFAIRFTLQGKHYSFTEIPDSGEYFLSDAFKAVVDRFSEPWNLPWPKLKIQKY